MNRRIIYSDNGVLTDLSSVLSDYKRGTSSIQMVAAEDALYIGSKLPFNNIYFKVDSGNTSVSALSIEHWDGKAFNDVVEVIDETIVSGKTLAQSGYISWTPSKNHNYQMDDTINVTGLGANITIYDSYWTKFTVSADFTSAAVLSWAGNLFSNDDDLGAEYPDLVSTDKIAAIATGKTDYQEQAVRAADILVNDLIQQGDIMYPDQILDRKDLRLASVQKVAEIVFRIFGEDYDKDRINAMGEYHSRLKKSFAKVDKNKDAREQPIERRPAFGVISR